MSCPCKHILNQSLKSSPLLPEIRQARSEKLWANPFQKPSCCCLDVLPAVAERSKGAGLTHDRLAFRVFWLDGSWVAVNMLVLCSCSVYCKAQKNPWDNVIAQGNDKNLSVHLSSQLSFKGQFWNVTTAVWKWKETVCRFFLSFLPEPWRRMTDAVCCREGSITTGFNLVSKLEDISHFNSSWDICFGQHGEGCQKNHVVIFFKCHRKSCDSEKNHNEKKKPVVAVTLFILWQILFLLQLFVFLEL